ncbi:hypothetical protein Hdeb2414_s0127g00805441 [Helianthus debilis subsp. tardiflorus]
MADEESGTNLPIFILLCPFCPCFPLVRHIPYSSIYNRPGLQFPSPLSIHLSNAISKLRCFNFPL